MSDDREVANIRGRMRYHSSEDQAELAHVQGAWLLDLPFFVIFALLFVPPGIHAEPIFAEDFGELSRAASSGRLRMLLYAGLRPRRVDNSERNQKSAGTVYRAKF